MDNLKEKAIYGVGWSAIESIANSGLGFLIGIILARILSPSEFGIIGIITIFIAISNSIVDGGFSSALVRKVDTKSIDYNTVFYLNLLLAILLYILLFSFSPVIGKFFNQPILIPITKVMGSILIINAFGLVQKTILVKQVDFKTQTKISLLASIVSGVIGIGMALGGFGVWSLVAQQLARQLLSTTFLWVYNSWFPILEFSKKSFQELFSFGSKLMISGIIDSVYKNLNYLVIGKFFTPFQLGQYTRAEQFNSIFSNNLTAILQRVSYPVLCAIQGDDLRLKISFQNIIKSTMLVTFVSMLGLVAIARPLILILIGPKWLTAVTYLQIICFSGLLYPLNALNLNILLVKGRSDLFLRLEILKKTIGVIPIGLGIYYGIETMLWGIVVVSFVAFFINSYYSSMMINYSTWAQIRDLLPTFLVSFFVATIMWSITFLKIPIWITLLFQCFLGFLITIIVHETLRLSEYGYLKKLFISKIVSK